jgi:ubiquinone biosynthesis protein COQ9
MNDHLEPLRAALVQAMLKHAVFDGWSEKSFQAAARDAGIEEGLARLAAPRGAISLLEAYIDGARAHMRAQLAVQDLAGRRIRDRIALAVRLWIEYFAAHREATRRAMTLLALPGHGALATRLMASAVDEMWRAIGDRSADFSFYTKRGLLAGVLSATFLYWLSDDSADCAESWAFLDRRINNVMGIMTARRKVEDLASRLPSPLRLLARRSRGYSSTG